MYINIRQLSKLSCDLEDRSDSGRYGWGQDIMEILLGEKKHIKLCFEGEWGGAVLSLGGTP